MSNPRYTISREDDGPYQLSLISDADEVILKGGKFATRLECENELRSIRNNAQFEARFRRLKTPDGQFYFQLVAVDGRTLATGRRYSSAEDLERAIDLVRDIGPAAPLEDPTPS